MASQKSSLVAGEHRQIIHGHFHKESMTEMTFDRPPYFSVSKGEHHGKYGINIDVVPPKIVHTLQSNVHSELVALD